MFRYRPGSLESWYVGNTMKDLDLIFGRDRILDRPVSENATTAAAIGASLHGYRAIVVHPRMDFMVLASDPMINQAAKWRHMLGGQVSPSVTFRGIVNRGGEQGAQHSQALHSWYAHVPGLRVVMPATASDARDLLIASTLCPDPVLYIDDRWLYETSEILEPIQEIDLASQGPAMRRRGNDVTLAAASHSVKLALDAAAQLSVQGIQCDVVDVRVLNPFDPTIIRTSVRKTGRIVAIDGGWATCGFAGEILASVVEAVHPSALRAMPARITLPSAPAPTSKHLEASYYPGAADIIHRVTAMVRGE